MSSDSMRALMSLLEGTDAPATATAPDILTEGYMGLPSANLIRRAWTYYRDLTKGSDIMETQYEYMTGDEASDHPRAYLQWLKETAVGEIEAAWDTITMRFQGDTLPVYRVITAPANWQPDPTRHPGIYWSWDKDAADAHWGDFSADNVKWRMVAKVKIRDIDWPATLAMNAHLDYQEEREVRIREGVPVQVLDFHQVD